VEFVARNGFILHARILLSVIRHNLVVYFLRFLYVILEVLIEGWHGSCITEICIFYKDDINVICELLAVKHGDLALDLFSNSVLDAFIQFYVLVNFYCAYSDGKRP